MTSERWEGPFDGNGFCPSCAAGRERQERDRLIAETARRVSGELQAKLIAAFGSGEAAARYQFETYKPETAQESWALRICNAFDPRTDNLLLTAPCGRGKTHLAGAIARKFIEAGIPVEYWRTSALLRFFRYDRTAEAEQQLIHRFERVPILVLDDLGAHKETEWGTSLLSEIVGGRIEADRNGLIVTSNLGLNDLAKMLSDRIPSRLQRAHIIQLDGPDRRSRLAPQTRTP